MSEILREIMDANCVDKNVAIYSMFNVIATTIGGANVNVPVTANLQCKKDVFFLCMGWSLSATAAVTPQGLFVATGQVWPDYRFQINNLTTGRQYMLGGPAQRTVMNTNLNNFSMIPEYVLFQPSDLVQGQFTNRSVDTAYTGFTTTTILLMGMEYRMRN